MEQEEDSLTLYFDSVIENFQNLTEEDKNVLREMEGTPQAEVLRKVLGPEVGATFQLAAPPSETERMFEGRMDPTITNEQEPLFTILGFGIGIDSLALFVAGNYLLVSNRQKLQPARLNLVQQSRQRTVSGWD